MRRNTDFDVIDTTFTRSIGRSAAMLAAVALAIGPVAVPTAVYAQTTTGALNIPADVRILGTNDPNNRSATAVVNGTVITGTDVDHRVALLVSASQGELPEAELQRVKMQVLRNLIDETLQIQAAVDQEIPVENAQVDQRYAELARQNFSSDPGQMDTYLLSIGSSPASLKRQIRGEMAWNNVIRRNISPFVNVSEEEVREDMARRDAEKGTDEYRLGEIYLSATPENQAAVLQNAQQIVTQLQQGGSFVAYARQFSESTSAVNGGDLGFLKLSTLPAAMAAQAQAMQPGQLNGPFEIPGGLMIMYLIDKRTIGQADPRDAMLDLKQMSINFEPGASEQQARARLERFTAAVQSIRGCGNAEEIAAGVGAEVVENQIRARSLPEQLQNSLLSIQVGQATPPFGSVTDGVRVLILCGRDDPEEVSLDDFDQLMNQKEQERIQKRAQRYLRDLRNDAYIEYS